MKGKLAITREIQTSESINKFGINLKFPIKYIINQHFNKIKSVNLISQIQKELC